jgi:transcriptional regulator with PAS, ATPase and Fis domain
VGLGQSIAAHERYAGASANGGPPGREFTALVGTSPSFAAAVAMAQRVAGYPAANVLLLGETGTGKELFARAIHNSSTVAGEPFVAINCSAIPDSMLESELFGYEKGAFTDARTSKRGLLEVAARGTVMLDEVQELPLNLQPKLLRVLEERRVRRLGALEEYQVNCRIIAASNRDLAACVEEGRFRSDLFYRLNVVRIDLPALRERRGDVDLLAQHFVEGICKEHELPRKLLSLEALVRLRAHVWLGNVRELKNTLENAIVMCDGEVIRPDHIRLRRHAVAHEDPAGLGDLGVGSANEPHAWSGDPHVHVPQAGVTLETVECELVRETLRLANGNRSLAARMLGVSRPTVLRKIERYHLA